MSFILDALRRAENQRGNVPRTMPADSTLGEIAEKPSSMPAPRWIAVIAIGALAIALMMTNVFRSRDAAPLTSTGTPDNRAMTPSQPTPFPAIAPDTPLADVVQPATREIRSLGREARVASAPEGDNTARNNARAGSITPGTVTVSQERLSATDTPARALTNQPDNLASREALPSYQEVALSGRKQITEFHLDIHVYAPEPERSFVFINHRKYREGQQLDEGGTVERITPAGVILNHRGSRFELVPD